MASNTTHNTTSLYPEEPRGDEKENASGLHHPERSVSSRYLEQSHAEPYQEYLSAKLLAYIKNILTTNKISQIVSYVPKLCIFYDMAEALLRKYPGGSKPVFVCHPGDLSNLRGQRNDNFLKLREHFGLQAMTFETNEGVRKGSLMLKTNSETFCVDRQQLAVSEISPGQEKAC